MKLSPLNIQRLIFLILIPMVIWGTKYYIRNKDSHQNTLLGVVEEIKPAGRDAIIIKFRDTPDYNVLSKIRTKQEIQKGDSIYKPMFSNEVFIYRKDQNENYKLHLKIRR